MTRQVDISIVRYSPEAKTEWDGFVRGSRNGTFLLLRDYMDYHSDRFRDMSLLIYVRRGGHVRLTCLLVANDGGHGCIESHGGLTYGGFVLPWRWLDGGLMLDIFGAVTDYYKNMGFKRLLYKPIPHIYHRYPAEEDLYSVFRFGGRLVESNISSAILLSERIAYNENSRRNAAKARKAGVTVEESVDYESFWSILGKLLYERYSTKPVHTLEEMLYLRSKLPENIKLYVAKDSDGAVIAGTVLYYAGNCVHAQYIAASPVGKAIGALPLLFADVIEHHCGAAAYFDFGISNERKGMYLNDGLLLQKNGLGGRAVVYNVYEIDF